MLDTLSMPARLGKSRWIATAVFTVLAACLFMTPTAFAQNVGPTIFDVRRSLPMEPNEPVFHDFYISAGPESGFKKGLYATVVRQIPVHDPIQNKQQATLNVVTGRLRIIHVEKGLTVGRMETETTDDERPVIEFEAIMIGDKIDLATITTEAPKKKPKAKTAQVENAESGSSATASVAVQLNQPTHAAPSVSIAPPAAPSTATTVQTSPPSATAATMPAPAQVTPVSAPATETSSARPDATQKKGEASAPGSATVPTVNGPSA